MDGPDSMREWTRAPGHRSAQWRAGHRRESEKSDKRNIDIESSPHREVYRAVVQRLADEHQEAPFTLPESAVVAKLLHALESPRPKARYSVTVPTHVLAFLKWVLPTRWLDAVLHRISDAENR